MVLFSFICFKSYNYFFVYWVLDLIISFIVNYQDYILKFTNIKVIIAKNYINLIRLSFVELLSFILVLIIYFKSKSEKEKEKEKEKISTNNNYELIYIDLSIKNNKYTLIFLFTLVDLIGRAYSFFYHLITRNVGELETKQIFWIISIDFLSRIFFLSLF